MPKGAHEAVTFSALKEESAVLADHAVHRPHPGHLIAPACGRRGNGDHFHARSLQALERIIGACAETATKGKGLIHVGQHEADVAELRDVGFG